MALSHAALLKTTLLDFPGEVASVIFTPGCNLRCPYCHNPSLVNVTENSNDLLPLDDIKAFIKKRSSLIGGVVITGGEPLLHDDLPELISYIHSINLKVKIDTNGLVPDRLAKLQADYIAMDIKTSPEHYYRLGLQGNRDRIKESIEYIISSGISHEFRTTVTEEIVTEQDVQNISTLLKEADHWYFTPFKPGNTLDPLYREKKSPSSSYMEKLLSIAKESGINSSIR